MARLALFLSFLWPCAFPAWNVSRVFTAGLPCTRHCHHTAPPEFSEGICNPRSACSHQRLYPDRIWSLWREKESLYAPDFPGFLELHSVYLSYFAPQLAKSFNPKKRSVCREGNKRDKSPSCHLSESPCVPSNLESPDGCLESQGHSTWIMAKPGSWILFLPVHSQKLE